MGAGKRKVYGVFLTLIYTFPIREIDKYLFENYRELKHLNNGREEINRETVSNGE